MRIAQWTEIGMMDDLGRMDTPLHRLDPRAKIIATLLFVGVVMSFPRYTVSALTPLFLYPLLLMSLGRIPPGPIVKKILVAAPLALVIGIFNPLLDREPMISIGGLVFSGGWLSFTSIMCRFVLTVGAVLVLVSCTGMQRIGAGLSRLGVPRVFVVQLLFVYRYLFVAVNEGAKLARSVELRSPGSRAMRPGVYGPVIGHLLLRSMDRAERIHRSMVARGFDGEVRVSKPGVWRLVEWAFVAGWTVFFAVTRGWDVAAGLGQLLTGRWS